MKILIAAFFVLLILGFALSKSISRPTSVDDVINHVSESGSHTKLESMLDSQDHKRRLTAIKAIFALQTEQAYSLLPKAISDRAIVNRVAIAQRLSIPPQKTAFPLVFKLLDDKEFEVRREAVKVLGEIKSVDYQFDYHLTAEE